MIQRFRQLALSALLLPLALSCHAASAALPAKVEQALKTSQQFQASVKAVEPAPPGESRPANSLLWFAVLSSIVLAGASSAPAWRRALW